MKDSTIIHMIRPVCLTRPIWFICVAHPTCLICPICPICIIRLICKPLRFQCIGNECLSLLPARVDGSILCTCRGCASSTSTRLVNERTYERVRVVCRRTNKRTDEQYLVNKRTIFHVRSSVRERRLLMHISLLLFTIN